VTQVDETPEFLSIDVGTLRFDPNNPRLPKSVDAADVDSVLKFMLEDAGLIDLMRSIAAQGFFPGEPLLVTDHPYEAGAYLVVEGNRRLAATKLLVNPELAPTSKKAVTAVAAMVTVPSLRIPCLRFPTYGAILKHLGYRHVTGVKEWEPLAKARFLKARVEAASGDTSSRLKFVARTIGSRADYVGRLLTTLEIYERWAAQDFFSMNGVDEDSVEFSLLSSALTYAHIYQFLGLASAYDIEAVHLVEDNLRFLLHFIYEKDETDGLTKLGESRNLGRLGRVLHSDSARTALLAGAELSEAEEALGDDAEQVRAAILKATSHAQFAVENLADADLGDYDLQIILTLKKTTSSLLSRATEQIRDSNDSL